MREQFIKLLSRASYHRAADRGSEYLKAGPILDEAAKIAFDEGWDFDTIKEIIHECKPLVSPFDIERRLDRLREQG